MSRPPKPWYWKARQAWYTDLGGVRRKLVDGPKNAETTRLAQLAFHRLMAQCLANPPIDGGNPTVACVVDDYLEQNKKDLAPSTFRENQMYLQKFCNEHGPRLVRDCIPYHLTTWVNAHPTWESNWTKSYAIRVVKRPFNWAVEMGLIEENPFASVKLPKCRNRRRPITLEEFEALLKAAGPTSRLGEILLFLWFTGCRPSELRHLQWGDIHLHRATPVIVIEEHKTNGTVDRSRRKPPVDEVRYFS